MQFSQAAVECTFPVHSVSLIPQSHWHILCIACHLTCEWNVIANIRFHNYIPSVFMWAEHRKKSAFMLHSNIHIYIYENQINLFLLFVFRMLTAFKTILNFLSSQIWYDYVVLLNCSVVCNGFIISLACCWIEPLSHWYIMASFPVNEHHKIMNHLIVM